MPNKIKILHVEDEADTSEVVKTVLEKEGYEIINASTGETALQLFEKENFNLALLDIMMPDMSGWDLFTRISKSHPECKIVFLTVLEVSDKRLNELRELGIKDYITKPFYKDDFVARIKKALQ